MNRRTPIAVLLVMTAGLLATSPATAGEQVDVVVEVAVKVVDDTDVDGVASSEDGFVIEAIIESRGVFRLGRHVEVDVNDLDKKTDHEAESWAKDLAKVDGVAWAEPVWVEKPEDMRFHAWPQGQQSATDTIEGIGAAAYLGLVTAHEVATGDGVVVAVLDTGVDGAHPHLAGRLLPGFDLVDDDPDPTDERNGVDGDGDGLVDEAYGHGTFVAGLVLQVAPAATVLPIRVLDADGRAEIPAVVDAIHLAIESGADIINLSFGLPSDEKPKSLKAALKEAKDRGVLVVAAAGNAGDDHKTYPASDGSVVAVGALDVVDDSHVTGFSSYGNWVLVAAPGVGITSSVPGGGYATWAGTSTASPLVAGQAALLVEVDAEAKRSDVEKAIKESARKMTGDHRVGKGAVDILESLLRMM